MADRKVQFTKVPLGGGGLVPNLLSGNVDAVVLYSPLSFQLMKSGEVSRDQALNGSVVKAFNRMLALSTKAGQ